jgi:hypothetical protein
VHTHRLPPVANCFEGDAIEGHNVGKPPIIAVPAAADHQTAALPGTSPKRYKLRFVSRSRVSSRANAYTNLSPVPFPSLDPKPQTPIIFEPFYAAKSRPPPVPMIACGTSSSRNSLPFPYCTTTSRYALSGKIPNLIPTNCESQNKA